MPTLCLCVLVLCLSACTLRSSVPPPASLAATVPGKQVYGLTIDLRTQQPIPFVTLIETLARSDVVAFGEEHYHPAIQAFALQMLQALAQQRAPRLALALEFLERDQQSVVNEYIHSTMDMDTLQSRLGASAAFMRFYFPLLAYARQQRLPVIAMNVPRSIARQVARKGLQLTLQQLTDNERAYLPEPLAAVTLPYRTYFLDTVAAYHPVQGEEAERFVEASHLKDDTMAAALTMFLDQHRGFTVLAIAGRFHFDYGKAIPALLRQRNPHLRIAGITALAVDADRSIDLQRLAHEQIADYLWFTTPAPEAAVQSHDQYYTLYQEAQER